MTSAEVRKVLTGMPNKSCELDAVDTKFLKDGLAYILEEITDLINFFITIWTISEKMENSNSKAADKEDKFM